MILLLIMAQVAGLSASNYTVDVPLRRPSRAPSWRDEFRGHRIDAAKWRFDTARNRDGWFNHEKQYYANDRPQNARVVRGGLTIEARREALAQAADWGGQAYTSAKLVSQRTFGFGFYEIHAKLPCARGTWPAIWMLPDGGTWPMQGEIDIMEMVGWQPRVVHATLHTGAFNHRLGTQRGAETTIPTACSAYHRYQLDWQPHAITIGVDGHGYLRVADDRPGGAAAWPFTVPFRLILNLAVGGDWGAARGIDDAALPQAMTVDYARFWKRPPDRDDDAAGGAP